SLVTLAGGLEESTRSSKRMSPESASITIAPRKAGGTALAANAATIDERRTAANRTRRDIGSVKVAGKREERGCTLSLTSAPGAGRGVSIRDSFPENSASSSRSGKEPPAGQTCQCRSSPPWRRSAPRGSSG